MKISIAIPIHNMQNAEFFLKRLLDSIAEQIFNDFEVVLTDNSPTDSLRTIAESYPFNVKYFLNEPLPQNGMATNTNEAIKRSTGDLIKIIYMDDYFAHKNSLRLIVESFTGNWLVSSCEHDDGSRRFNVHHPTYNDNIHEGYNTIGSPSVLTLKQGLDIYMDEMMTWLLDCDLYKRLHDNFGEPTILNDVNIVIGVGDHQTTSILADDIKNAEQVYMKDKHGKN